MNPVQQKIPCVFEIEVTEKISSKRNNQSFKVSASRNVTVSAQKDDIISAKATEKLDGTCCLIKKFQGQPWLWARHDRKPSKVGERRFVQFKNSIQLTKETEEQLHRKFVWDPKRDFKEVPANWIPASRQEVIDGIVMPDNNGHTLGWVPIDLNSRQHCWHLSVVNLKHGFALVLREAEDGSNDLVIEAEPLSSLCQQTCELVGTNINGNPYGIGSKKCPIHFLIQHGSLTLACPQTFNYDAILNWFNSEAPGAQVEGAVWHCANGELYKLHRHHLDLKWPVSESLLVQRKVRVRVEMTSLEEDDRDIKKGQGQSLFSLFSRVNGQNFNSIRDLHRIFTDDNPAS